MADLPVQPVLNYGNLMSAYGEQAVNQENANTNQLNTQSQIPLRQANTALINQQSQGYGLANQLTAMKLAYTQSALAKIAAASATTAGPTPGADASGSAGGAPGVPGGVSAPFTPPDGSPLAGVASAPTPTDPGAAQAAALDQQFRKEFFVNKGYTPQEMQAVQAAQPLMLMGDDSFMKIAQQNHDIRVQNATIASQTRAQGAADSTYAVAAAPPGAAFARLQQEANGIADPAAKAAINQNIRSVTAAVGVDPNHPEKWTPDQAAQVDAAIRDHATQLHNAVFQYTGDTLKGENGITINSRTGQRPIGDASQGQSPEKWADLAKSGMTLVDSTDSQGHTSKVPQYVLDGYGNGRGGLNGWIRAMAGPTAAASPGSPLTSNPAGGSPAASAASPARVPTSAGVAPPKAPAASAPAPATPPTRPGQAASGPAQPYTGAPGSPTAVNPQFAPMKAALADPTYRAQTVATAPVVGNRGPGLQDVKDIDMNAEAKKGIYADAGALTQSSSQGLAYAQAAKQILTAKGAPTTGLYGPVAAELSKVFPSGVDATNYQEAAKYLGNLSVQNFKQNFGSRPANAEFQIQMRDLSPSMQMQAPAIRDLLNWNIRAMQYGVDTAQRVRAYDAAGNDPKSFWQWNQKYFPREGATSPTPVPVKNKADFDALPSGAPFTWNGQQGVK
jgi:hypothetical protein